MPYEGDLLHELFDHHKAAKILVEPHFTATQEYRILIYRGRVLDILLRKPAYIIGDGRQTILQLIGYKNQFRKQQGFSQIQYNRAFVAGQGYKIRSIPTEGCTIILQPVCNLALGGEVERCPISSLHPNYKPLFKKLYQKSLLCFMGLDLMTSDPSTKPTPSTAFINEFNSCPSSDVSYFADINSNDPFFGVNKILQAIQNDATL